MHGGRGCGFGWRVAVIGTEYFPFQDFQSGVPGQGAWCKDWRRRELELLGGLPKALPRGKFGKGGKWAGSGRDCEHAKK